MTTAAVSAATLRAHVTGSAAVTDPWAEFGDGGFVWEHGDTTIVTAGVAAQVPAGAADAFLATIATSGDLAGPGTGPIAVGALPFTDAPSGLLTVPRHTLVCGAGGECWRTTIAGPADPGPSPGGRARTTEADPGAGPAIDGIDRTAWDDAIAKVLTDIAQGTLTKAVLARVVRVDTARPISAVWVLRQLRAREPGRYLFATDDFFGASPELLVERAGTAVRSRPLAGSSRSPDPAALASLAGSDKDRREHQVVVDAMRTVIAAACRDVRTEGPAVIGLADLGHLATRITATACATTPSALGLALRLHPTPAVAGMPTTRALSHIAALEGDRGRYAGPVGWVDAAGNGQFAVALRAAEITGPERRTAWLRAGAGIVAGSDASLEWAEIDAKLQPILHALAPSTS